MICRVIVMLGPLTEDNLSDYLTAFSDGELDAAQTLSLWTYLSEHSQRGAAMARLQDHHRLTLAAKRLQHPVASADLRDRITAVVSAGAAGEPAESLRAEHAISPRRRSARRRIGYVLAMAAGLLIGVTSTFMMTRSSPIVAAVPGEVLVKVARTHAECSRIPESWHNATFEATDAQLAQTVKVSLGTSSDAPDLTAAGFRFVGAGPCHNAGGQTVHLLYHADKPKSVAAVSLFVQPDVGQFPRLEAKRVYRVSSPTSAFPMLAWRDGEVIFMLVTDSDAIQSAVLQVLHPTPADQIVTVASR